MGEHGVNKKWGKYGKPTENYVIVDRKSAGIKLDRAYKSK